MLNLFIKEEQEGYTQKTDYDGLWKNIISQLFEEFILFMSPDLYEKIDFTSGHDFLEQELFQEVLKVKKGKRYVDKVAKVFLKDGREKYILIHIEIQGDSRVDLSKRMFQYFYLLYDRYKKDVYSFALLTDIKTSHPEPFHYSFFGTEVIYRYNVYNLSKEKIATLETSKNPIAMAILAGIYFHTSKQNNAQRFELKRKLLQTVLNTERYPQELYISELFHFIDYLLYIPKELTKQLRDEILPKIEKEATHMIHSEKVKASPTLAEVFEKLRREGREEGKEEGALLERRNFVVELIREKFDDEKIARMTKLTVEEVQEIRKSL